MKRLCSMLLVLALALSMLPQLDLRVFAAEEDPTATTTAPAPTAEPTAVEEDPTEMTTVPVSTEESEVPTKKPPTKGLLEIPAKYLTYEIIDGGAKITDCQENAFGDVEIPATIDGYPVTAIGKNAFDNCTYLTTIDIPDSVTIIEDKAFSGCTNLCMLYMGKSVAVIGNEAFSGCNSLTDVYIEDINAWCKIDFKEKSNPMEYAQRAYIRAADGNVLTEISLDNSVTEIPDGTFKNITYLTSIVIPDSVTTIGASAFSNCEGLTSVAIGGGVLSIGDSAFNNCDGLTSITIPDSVITIEDRAFYSCDGLSTVTIGDGVTTIGDYAFCGGDFLTVVNMGKNVTTIGTSAFVGSESLSDVYYAGTEEQWNAITIGDDNSSLMNATIHFAEEDVDITDFLEYEINDEKVTITGYKDGIPAELNIPAEIEGYPVTTIGDSAFVYCTRLQSITIPDSVTTIGNYAFSGCTSLTSITIPDSVGTIDADAFDYCFGLKDVYITDPSDWCKVDFGSSESNPMRYATAGHILDKDGNELSKIVLDSSVTKIPEHAFSNCTGLVGITIPDSVTTIGRGAFLGTGLTTVTIPDSVMTIDGLTFADCTSLTTVTIPDCIATIGSYAFAGCTGLTTVTIPASMTTIYPYAFSDCTGLTTVTMPGSVTSIDTYAFSGCTALTNISVPDSLTTVGDFAFFDCINLQDVYYSGTKEQWDKIEFVGNYNIYIERATLHCNWHIHSFTNYVSNNDATCTEDGTETAKCDRCEETDTRIVTALGHSFTNYVPNNDVTCTADGTKTAKCDRCEVTDTLLKRAQGHSWNEGVYTDATAETDGYTTYTCTICNEEKTVVDEFTKLYAYEVLGGAARITLCRDFETSKIVIPSTLAGYPVHSISYYAFAFHDNLISVTIPDGVIAIGDWAFTGCINLTDINIPNGVTTIGHEAFRDCTSLTSVDIPDSLITIGSNAFSNCTSLTSVTIPDSVKTIGDHAFSKCSSLSEITIPDSVTSIGSGAFAGCSNLESMTIPFVGYVLEFATGTYQYPFGYIFGIFSYTGCVSTTQYYYASNTSSIRYETYYIPENLKSVTVTGGDILHGAFYNCTSLTSVTIQNNVETIGREAFRGCTSLTSVTIPDSVTTIGEYAFFQCSSLSKITIPDSVTTIGEYAFFQCSSLSEITIPDSVTTIGEYAFSKCSSLSEITIPDSVSDISDYLFEGCYRMTTITIPDSVTIIGDYAFCQCSSLSEITIPDSVTIIGDYAFCQCSSLSEIMLPASVRSVDASAFFFCHKLSGIWVDKDNRYYSNDSYGVLFNKDKTRLISVPGTISSYVIPDGVWTIGKYACRYLTVVTIPDSVTTIDEYAFDSYTDLKDVIYSGSKVQWDSIKIGDHNGAIKSATIHYNGHIHSFISYTLDKAATCTEEGAETGTCEHCGDTDTRVVSALGHSFTNYVSNNDATCTEDGTETAKCDRCEETSTRIVTGSALGHSWDDGVYTDPTTEANGYTTYICTVCRENKVVDDEFTKLPDGSFTYEETESGEVTITSFGEDITGELIIPKSIDGKPVTTIADGAFRNCTGLTVVRIPASVTNIGKYAFAGCDDLQIVHIGNTQPKRNAVSGLVIGDHAFDGCDTLEQIQLGSDVTTIGDYAFRNCTSLTSITIPDSVTTIGDGAFYGCSAATSVSIGTGVVTIGNYAFYGCTGLATIYFRAADMNDLNENSCIFDNAGTGCVTVHIGSAVTRVPAYLFYIKNVALNIAVTFESNSVCESIGSYAFAKCTIRRLTIPDSVKTIGDHAFYYCSSLPGITLGNGLTTIGAYAFYRCTSLTEITIPDSVTTIGAYAFYGCTGLTAVTIPDSVTAIENSAFYGCSGLTNLTIGNGVTTIKENAFYNCESLAGVAIPDSVTTIGKCAFYNCTGMTQLTIGAGLTTIEESAFENCKSLTSLIIPGTVKTIGVKAFRSCSGLTELTIADGVTTISDFAFDNCTGLTTVFIPESVESIGTAPFRECTALTEIRVDENNANYCSDASGVLYDKEMTLLIQAPGTIQTYTIPDSVTDIGEYAFYKCTGLTGLTIGSGVITIGKSAFTNCTGLTAVAIPDSVTTIGNSAFYDCSGMTVLTLGSSVASIGDSAFACCTGLTAVTIPDSVATVGDYAFYKCTGLTGLTIGSVVTTIGDYAFAYCSGLTAVAIPDRVTVIGDSAFFECTGLTGLTLGSRVTSIGSYAFAYCTGLTAVAIPDSVKTIGGSAFRGCAVITELTIGTGVTTIGDYAFYGCSGLTKVIIPDNVTDIGSYAFAYCDGITELTIGLRVTAIGESAFRGCTGLTAVVIPNRVTAISNSTFYGCTGLTGVTIGTRVTSIGISAFEGCTGLTAVVIPNNVKTIGSNAFARCTGLTDITIGTGVTSIGDAAFSGCTGFTVITIPENVTTIGNRLVDGCTGLEKVLYTGTREKWGKATVGQDNATLLSLLECKYDVDEHPKTTTVVSGENVLFSVKVPGGVVAVKSYKWQYRKVYKWFDTTLTGYNTDTLTVPANGSRHGYDYRCVITFTNGKIVYSEPAELTVITSINIVSHPNDQVAVLGYKGQFTAAAEGEGIKYQWQYKRPGGSAWIDTAMEGATKPTVLIETTTARNGYQYRCKITDVTGKVSYTDPATMYVLSLTAQPKDKTALTGTNVQFTVSTSVTEGFTYQWQYKKDASSNWTNTTMTGYNTATLTVGATMARNGYQYRCVLTGAKNSKLESNSATLTVCRAVSVSQQPVTQLADVGSQVQFAVTASDAVSYQWQYSKNGTTWTNTTMTGYNTDTLTVAVTAARDGYKYRCAMKSLDGTVFYSDSATLLVGIPAAITSQPTDAEAVDGANAIFTVEAEGAVSYQWYCRQSAETGWNPTKLTGYDTATLTVEATAARSGYKFRCVVTGKDGKTVTSDEVVLKVISIDTQPVAQRVAVNTDAKFVVHVHNATDATTYQWQYRNGLDGTWTNVGTNSNILIMPTTAEMNGYHVKCVITDSCGNTMQTDIVWLYVVKITDQPRNTTVTVGENAVFSLTLSDTTDASYQWQYSRDNGTSWSDTTATGYNTNTLTVEATTNRDSYLYRCVITMPNGSTLTSNAAMLTVNALPPSAEITTQPGNATVVQGTKVTYQLEAINATAYLWQYQKASGQAWTTATMFTGYNTKALTVQAETGMDGYKFRCVITGMDGDPVISKEVSLNVISINTQPGSQRVIAGANAKFVVSLNNATETTKYQWKYSTDGANWKNCAISGYDTSVLIVPATTDRNGYQFKCVITDNYGNTMETNAVKLSVVWITKDPVSCEAAAGETVSFTVSLSDTTDVTYEWEYRRDSSAAWTTTTADGYNTAKLSVEAAGTRNGYEYRCVITLPNGTKLVSDAATLTVVSITSQPSSVTVLTGTDVTFQVSASGAVSYRWQVWNPNNEAWSNTTMTGYNEATLQVKATASYSGYKFRCVVTGANGKTAVSKEATLNVISIAAQPTAKQIAVGNSAKFTVSVLNATSSTKYQWQVRKPTDTAWSNTGLEGYSTAALTVPGTTDRNGYQYRCVITDSYGNTIASDPAKLTVVSITAQPQNVEATIGTTAVFSLELTDTTGLIYQWQYSKNGTTWSNATSDGSNTSSVEVEATVARNGYQYRCVITLPNSQKITSDAATLKVISITSQPASVTVVEGTQVQFKVEATDAESYRWHIKKPGENWAYTTMTGYNTDTLTVDATAARHGYEVRCAVTTKSGATITSDVATLKVIYIYTQPTTQRVISSANAKFTVSLDNAVTSTTYQWMYRTSADATWIKTSLTGYNTGSLTVPASGRNGYQYKCVITDAYNNVMETDVVDLIVVSIKTQPADQSVKVGENAVFSVAVSDETGLSYQWQYSSNNGTTWTNTSLSGYNTNTLTVEATTARDGYQYRCVITLPNNQKLTSQAATLTAIPLAKAAVITTQPSSATVVSGAKVAFKIVADNATAYQWQLWNDETEKWANTGLTGNATQSLTVEATTARSGYKFRCAVTGDDGSVVYSKEVLLKVISISVQPVSQQVAVNNDAKFTVSLLNPTTTTQYQWMYRTSTTGTWMKTTLSGYNSKTLTVGATQARNGYQYKCVITDSYGNQISTSIVKLTVVYVTNYPDDTTVSVGSTATFSFALSDSTNVKYQWQYSANGTSWSNTTMSGYDTNTLKVTATAARNGYMYRCIVTLANGHKITTSAAKLTVK